MAARILDLKPSALPSTAEGSFSTPRLGTLTSVDEQGELTVSFPGCATPVSARLVAELSMEQLRRACEQGCPVVLIFENGDPQKPLVVGLVHTPTAQPAAAEVAAEGVVVEADCDGKYVRVRAQEHIELRCGQASITLLASGRVVIRGTYVETYASDTNRIKGGQVRIN
jgi:hypothetical protein